MVKCSSCGLDNPDDGKFCTNCGKPVEPAQAAAAAPGAQGFLATLDERLAQNGFEKVEPPAVLSLDRWMRRKRFELAKVGMITTVCGIKTLTETATSAYVQNFSKSVFDFACSNKGFLARNAFQQLLVYPVLVAPAYDADVETFLNSYWHKHWMAYEYPVVVSLSARQLAMHRSTPVWGAAFHGSFKREAESLFAV
jgi:hypothetical protein